MRTFSFVPSIPFAPLAIALACAASGVACSSSDSGSSAPPAATESYKSNVYPLMVRNCALTACHGSVQSNLGIYISNDPNQIYTLLTTKTSGEAQGMPYVKAGDPMNSWIMLKLDGANVIAACGGGAGCGTEMPPFDQKPGDMMLSAADRDVFRNWITQGAKQN